VSAVFASDSWSVAARSLNRGPFFEGRGEAGKAAAGLPHSEGAPTRSGPLQRQDSGIKPLLHRKRNDNAEAQSTQSYPETRHLGM
jgi:hypothetical protein